QGRHPRAAGRTVGAGPRHRAHRPRLGVPREHPAGPPRGLRRAGAARRPLDHAPGRRLRARPDHGARGSDRDPRPVHADPERRRSRAVPGRAAAPRRGPREPRRAAGGAGDRRGHPAGRPEGPDDARARRRRRAPGPRRGPPGGRRRRALRGECERLIAALGIAPRVRLAGIRRDVAALMGAFDVLALTSLWEGLPRVIPQAMAAGVPIVASAVGGVTEVIEDGLTGLLVPPGAPDVLAGRLRELLLDRRRGQALAARARECAGEFELDEMLRRLDALYRELGG